MIVSICKTLLQKKIWRSNEVVPGEMMGCQFKATVMIESYKQKIQKHYSAFGISNPEVLCQKANIPFAFGFDTFGLVIEFERPAMLELHSTEKILDLGMKTLIERYGVVILRNAVLSSNIKDMCHDNNFPHLNFHRDRNDQHDNKFSMYTRNPENPKQVEPRTASTIFIDNAVAHLQALTEGVIPPEETGRRSSYEIFDDALVKDGFGRLMVEQPWDAPTGTGEICAINNRTVLHSSYKKKSDKGYPIGARYLY